METGPGAASLGCDGVLGHGRVRAAPGLGRERQDCGCFWEPEINNQLFSLQTHQCFNQKMEPEINLG